MPGENVFSLSLLDPKLFPDREAVRAFVLEDTFGALAAAVVEAFSDDAESAPERVRRRAGTAWYSAFTDLATLARALASEGELTFRDRNDGTLQERIRLDRHLDRVRGRAVDLEPQVDRRADPARGRARGGEEATAAGSSCGADGGRVMGAGVASIYLARRFRSNPSASLARIAARLRENGEREQRLWKECEELKRRFIDGDLRVEVGRGKGKPLPRARREELMEELLAVSHAWFKTWGEGTLLCYARRALTEWRDDEAERSG